jgi:hypothetical protein
MCLIKVIDSGNVPDRFVSYSSGQIMALVIVGCDGNEFRLYICLVVVLYIDLVVNKLKQC